MKKLWKNGVLVGICQLMILFQGLWACSTDQDCNDNGVCFEENCLCFSGWRGDECNIPNPGRQIVITPEQSVFEIVGSTQNNLLSLGNLNISLLYGVSAINHRDEILYVAGINDLGTTEIYQVELSTSNIQKLNVPLATDIISIEYDFVQNQLFGLNGNTLVSLTPYSTIVTIGSEYSPVLSLSTFDSLNEMYYAIFEMNSQNYLIGVDVDGIVTPPTEISANVISLSYDHITESIYLLVNNNGIELWRIRPQVSSTPQLHHSFSVDGSYYALSFVNYASPSFEGFFVQGGNSRKISILSDGNEGMNEENTLDIVSVSYLAPLGCDGIPSSRVEWDSCGVCGGDGTSCIVNNATSTGEEEKQEEDDNSSLIIGAAAGGGVLLLAIIICCIGIFILCRKKGKDRTFDSTELEARDAPLVKQDSRQSPPPESPKRISNNSFNSQEWWHIDYDELKIEKKIGSGGFGIVYLGEWRDQQVAIKMLQSTMDEAQLQEFQREAALMVTMKPNPNVVKLYGVCMDTSKPMAIVTEFLEYGSLKDLLDNGHKFSFLDMISIAKDIAKGMQHLHAEKIYHRDLSARNILMGEGKGGKMTGKVSDFGLSRISESKEATTKSDTGPLKWMAPESLLHKKYSAKSDVWSYAVTLWELLSGGEEPYPGMDNIVAASNVMHSGLRLKPPEKTPLKLAEMMVQCWETKPEDRPTFKEVLRTLDQIEEDVTSNPFY